MLHTTTETMPRVTFCLFAYNQEAYIREAVLGALAQTYEPLEIIISDDCSSDRTFEIARETAADYKGPHTVNVLRNEQNLGLVGHVNKLFDLAQGELIVLAAGDDISVPERTHEIVSIWRENPTVDAICSAYIQMTETGKETGIKSLQSFKPSERWLTTKKTFWLGCSAAYTKRLYTHFGPMVYRATEDVVYYRRALLLGGVRYLEKPLVRYRMGCGISTQKLAKEVKVIRRNDWRLSLALQMLSDIAKIEQTPFHVSVSVWWCRALEWRLLFKNILLQRGSSRLFAYLKFMLRFPFRALLKLSLIHI